MEVKLTKAELQYLITCVMHCANVIDAGELPTHNRWFSTDILKRVPPRSRNPLGALRHKLTRDCHWDHTGGFIE